MKLGPFAFNITAEDVRQFRLATGLAAEGPVPVAFLARFFTEEKVLQALRAHYGARVPIHVAQSFKIHSKIDPGHVTGLLEIEGGRVAARLADGQGRELAEVIGEFAFR